MKNYSTIYAFVCCFLSICLTDKMMTILVMMTNKLDNKFKELNCTLNNRKKIQNVKNTNL